MNHTLALPAAPLRPIAPRAVSSPGRLCRALPIQPQPLPARRPSASEELRDYAQVLRSTSVPWVLDLRHSRVFRRLRELPDTRAREQVLDRLSEISRVLILGDLATRLEASRESEELATVVEGLEK